MLGQKPNGGRRYILGFRGEDAGLSRKLGQGRGVLVISNDMVICELPGRTLRVWVEQHHGVAQAVGGLNHHPAELTASQEPNMHRLRQLTVGADARPRLAFMAWARVVWFAR